MIRTFKNVKPTESNVEFIYTLAKLNGCNYFDIPANDRKGAVRLSNSIRQYCYDECKVRFDTNNMTWITTIIFGNGIT